jgi:hypothetical protein
MLRPLRYVPTSDQPLLKALRFKDIADKDEAAKEHITVCNIICVANKEISRDDYSKFMDFAQMYWRQYQTKC